MNATAKRRVARIEEALASVVTLGSEGEDTQAFTDALMYRANGGLWHGRPAIVTFLDWCRSGELSREAQRRGMVVPGERINEERDAQE